MLNIDYKLTGKGWASCEISDGSNSYSFNASYLSDALGDLLKATVDLTHGVPKVIARFEEEPGEHRLVLEKLHSDNLQLTILHFKDTMNFEADEKGQKVFQITTNINEWIAALYQAATSLLNEHGEDGYRAKWHMHEFPKSNYEYIANYLNN